MSAILYSQVPSLHVANPIEIEVSWFVRDNLYFQGETFLDAAIDGIEDLKFIQPGRL